jgi:SacI homology domain
VAQIFDFPIYAITEVAFTPCSSHRSAEDAIAKTSLHLRSKTTDTGVADSDSGEVNVEEQSTETDDVEDAVEQEDLYTARDNYHDGTERSSIAEDVISKRGSYGRFAQRWFSKNGWMLDQKRNMGLSNSPSEHSTSSLESSREISQDETAAAKISVAVADVDVGTSALLPKLLRTAQILFGSSKSFFFSYDYDITRNLANRNRSPNLDEALHRQVDPVFFWNKHMLHPFADAGQESLLLPLMHGFIGQRSFAVDSNPSQTDDGMTGSVELSNLSPAASLPDSPHTKKSRDDAELSRGSEKGFLLTIISRRSTKRAGLRYLRRGVDEDGRVANAVETEQILSTESWNTEKIYSFLQIRGSIPVFFTQSPYSLKPAPVIQHSSEANYIASRKHFQRIRREYGRMQVVNLVEKHGIEAPIGEEYRRKVQRLNEEAAGEEDVIPFEWFDFHAACRGMKFENVSLLLGKLRPILDDFGGTVELNGSLERKQRGVLRTNCMDCLDRTNVCQSSFAWYMLEAQLKEEGIDMSAQADQENSWFNALWADNGDAISKQYASTAAMKGDYTRTKKRNYRGTLNDLSLSLTRFYNG